MLDVFHTKHVSFVGERKDVFMLYRLLCPQLDKERTAYNMKQGTLGKAICETLKLEPSSKDRNASSQWNKTGKGTAFADVCAEICHKKVGNV